MKSTSKVSQVCLAVGMGALAGGLSSAWAEDPPPNPTGWKTTAAAGVTLTRGNSETLMVNANVRSEKKWDKNEIQLGAGVTYGEDHNNVNASSITGLAQYNRLFTERFYGYAHLDAINDDIADVAYRVTLSPGAGYYFLKNDKFTLSGEAGPGVVFEQFHNQDSQAYWTLRIGEKFTWQINKNAKLWQTLDYNPKVDDFGDYVLNAEIGIATKITTHLDLRLVAQDTFRSEPAPGREENDLKLMAGVGYTF